MIQINLFTLNQLQVMFDLQHKCNKLLIAEDYVENTPENVDFNLAADKEFFESFDHLNYKWWKKDLISLSQYALEMVDVIHFIISEAIVRSAQNRGMSVSDAAEFTFSHSHDENRKNMLNEFSAVLQAELNEKGNTVDEILVYITAGQRESFVSGNLIDKLQIALTMAQLAGCTVEDVFNKYVAKNALNIFRASNGYKDGTYIKMWNGKEDNHYIEQFMQTNDMSQPDAVEQLNAYLTTTYALVKAGA